MIALDVVRAAIPNATQRDAEHIVWGRTPFPFAAVSPRSLYKAAAGYQRAVAKGVTLCDHCERPAVPGKWECKLCRDALNAARGYGSKQED